MSTPRATPARRPLPVGVEVSLTVGPGGVRGVLHGATLCVEARGDSPEAVLAELVRRYVEAETDTLLA